MPSKAPVSLPEARKATAAAYQAYLEALRTERKLEDQQRKRK